MYSPLKTVEKIKIKLKNGGIYTLSKEKSKVFNSSDLILSKGGKEESELIISMRFQLDYVELESHAGVHILNCYSSDSGTKIVAKLHSEKELLKILEFFPEYGHAFAHMDSGIYRLNHEGKAELIRPRQPAIK